jgi:MerR family transcriptional regulator, mercuric resistance operon regulatory protein
VTGLRAGELAEAAGVNRETLRYYERRGVLPEPPRTPGGHRLYPPAAVIRLRAIRAAQRLGFTLDEAAAALAPGHRWNDDLRSKLADLRSQIDKLQSRARTLEATAHCEDLLACATEPDCPIPFTETDRADERSVVPDTSP